MTFRLSPSASGHVLEVIGFLHAENKLACYTARSGPRELAAGVPVDVELGFDSADPACRAPIQLTDLAVVVGGTIEVESRQEWALRARYTLQP